MPVQDHLPTHLEGKIALDITDGKFTHRNDLYIQVCIDGEKVRFRTHIASRPLNYLVFKNNNKSNRRRVVFCVTGMAHKGEGWEDTCVGFVHRQVSQRQLHHHDLHPHGRRHM